MARERDGRDLECKGGVMVVMLCGKFGDGEMRKTRVYSNLGICCLSFKMHDIYDTYYTILRPPQDRIVVQEIK